MAAWLEGEAEPPGALAAVPGLEENLRLQDRVAQSLRGVRHTQGALDLETIEPRAVFTDGALADLEEQPKNRARELIEDLMVAANGVSARFLDGRGFPSLRRVLRSPERWDRIVGWRPSTAPASRASRTPRRSTPSWWPPAAPTRCASPTSR